MKSLVSAAVLALTLVGCATIDAQTRNLLSSKVPAYAAVDGVLLEGTATLFADRTGTVQVSSSAALNPLCIGELRYTATAAGVLVLHCAGAGDVAMDFRTTSATSGFGYGNTVQGVAAVAWGMSAAHAAAYLRLPVAPAVQVTAQPIDSPAL